MTDATPAATPEAPAPEAEAPATPEAPAVETPATETPEVSEPQKQSDSSQAEENNADSSQEALPDFVLPDEYKDKPWAEKVKSQEDLYKQIENLTSLVGKKSVAIDFENSTPEQIEEHFASTRPTEQSAYAFGEDADEGFSGEIGKLFFDNGIPEYVGNKIIEGYEALEAQATDADAYTAMMKESFGEKYDAVVTNATAEFTQHLSEADQAKLLDKVPNEFLGVIYRLVNSMQKSYGAEEGIGQDNQGGQIVTATFEEKTTKLRAEMRDIDNNPYGRQEDYNKKKAELDALYQNRVKTQGRKK